MRIPEIIGFLGLVIAGAGVSFAISWPWGLVFFGLGLYIDSMIGKKNGCTS